MGRIGALLRRRGARLRVVQPNRGDALPPPGTVAGAVVFGGAMSANDDHDAAIAAELRWIEAALSARLPLFGVCLGAQIMARVLGALVTPRRDGAWEIGYRDLTPTPAGAALFGDARRFMQWHGEGFGLPAGATRLAAGDAFAEQAFAWDRSLAVQFHPEVGRAALRGWLTRWPQDLSRPGADTALRVLDDDAAARPAVEAWIGRALDLVFGPVTDRSSGVTKASLERHLPAS